MNVNLEITEKLKDIDITQSRKPLDDLSLEIYQEIEKYKDPVPVLR